MAGAVCVTMMLSGALAAPLFSVFVPAWTEEFGWSRTAIAGAFSFGTVVAALVGPLVGRSLDRYGGRLVMGGGALLMGASLVGMGFAGSLLALYLTFAVGRMAMMNVQNLGAHAVIANWFVRRRALATAVAVNGSRIGLGGWPLAAATVIASAGWREACWALGVAVGALAIVPLVLIVARQPEEVGLRPDGRAVRSPAGPAAPALAERRWRPRDAVRTTAFWALTASHMAAMVAGGGFGVHRIPLFVDRGLSDAWIGPVLIIHAAGMVVGGFLAAWLMDRMPRRLVIAVSMAGASAALAVASAVPPGAPMALFTFAESAAFGGVFAMLPVVYADYFGRASIGTIRGLTHPIVVAANAAGVAFDATGAYAGALLGFSGALGVGAVSALMARPPIVTVQS